MAIRPQLVSRAEQPYASITNSLPMPQLSDQLQPQIGEIFGWLAARGIQPAGPPFWKYNVINAEGTVEVEVGVPTADEISGDDRVQPHLLPGGNYAVARHVGHPQNCVTRRVNCSTGPPPKASPGTCGGRSRGNSGWHAWRSTCTIR